MKVVLAALLLFSVIIAQAQNPVLSGTVKDNRGQAIPGAGVYLSGYKTATVTDADGKFKFTTLTPGTYDILVQYMGFLPGKASATLTDKDVSVDFKLEENVTDIKGVTILTDEQRRAYIKIFKDNFIGVTANAEKCKLLNPEVLNINFEDRKLTVTTSEFLVVENPVLGYRVKYLLELFEFDYKTNIVYYEGYPNFEEMEGSKSKRKRWEKEREIAYLGSAQHFYRALYNKTSTADGFIINTMNSIPNQNRLPDSVIEANIKRLSKTVTQTANTITIGNDSLFYWTRERAKPKKMDILNRAVVNPDTLVHTYDDNIKYINFTGDLYIIYTKEKEAPGISFTGYQLSRPFDVVDSQVSRIRLLKRPIGFYSNGSVADPTSSLYSGYWAYEKIGDQVPIDYVSSSR